MRTLIKIGGTLLDEPSSRVLIARQLAAAEGAGNQIAVVHGGGRQLTRFLEAQGVASRFVEGLRVTTDSAIDAVVQILAGLVNKRFVAALRAEGANAVGLSGIDGRLTTAFQKHPDLGWVGEIGSTDATLLTLLTNGGYLPVLACVSGDDQGVIWNVNADHMAAACARAFEAERLIFLTDVAGVLDEAGQIIPTLGVPAARRLMASGVAKGGMLAKLTAALSAVEGSVASVVIASGAEPGVLERLLSGGNAGTYIGRENSGC